MSLAANAGKQRPWVRGVSAHTHPAGSTDLHAGRAGMPALAPSRGVGVSVTVVGDRLFKGLPLPPSGDSSVLFLIKSSSGSANGHHCTQAHVGRGVGTELGGPSTAGGGQDSSGCRDDHILPFSVWI